MRFWACSLLFVAAVNAQSPTWTQQTISNPPYYNGYLQIKYGNGAVRWFGTDNQSSIYSNSQYRLTASGSTRLGTSGSMGSSPCPASTGTWPGDHHPIGQLWYDSDSNELFMAGGVCSGTAFDEMWKLDGTCTSSCTMTQVMPTHTPWGFTSDKWQYSDCVYDPSDAIAFCFGYDSGPATKDNMLYCPTHGGGSLSGAQTAAGCTGADDWAQLTVTCSGADCSTTQPPGRQFPRLQYIGSGLILQFGGSTAGDNASAQNKVFQYTVATKVWLEKNNGSGTAPPAVPYTYSPDNLYSQAPFACVIRTQQCYEFDVVNGNTWRYDIASATWSNLGGIGGPGTMQAVTTMTYDVSRNALVMLAKATMGTEIPEIWVGQLPPGGVSVSGKVSASGAITIQ